MITPESDNPAELSRNQQELLHSIAASLKGIHASLQQLTGAVEGVAESIETAHEPEGDLGIHLVGALRELSSALHKRAQQERTPQPSPRSYAPLHQRREDTPQQTPSSEHRTRQERAPQAPPHHNHPPEDPEPISSEAQEDPDAHGEPSEALPHDPQVSSPPLPQQSRQRPRRSRRGSRSGNHSLPHASAAATAPSLPAEGEPS